MRFYKKLSEVEQALLVLSKDVLDLLPIYHKINRAKPQHPAMRGNPLHSIFGIMI
jgi:hypothetical protein